MHFASTLFRVIYKQEKGALKKERGALQKWYKAMIPHSEAVKEALRWYSG